MEPAALSQTILLTPLPLPTAEIDLKVKCPSEVTRLTAIVPPVVDTLTPFTVSPDAPDAEMPP